MDTNVTTRASNEPSRRFHNHGEGHYPCIGSTHQVRPDDHLLGEAEDAQAAALQRPVEYVAGVGHHRLALEYSAQFWFRSRLNK